MERKHWHGSCYRYTVETNPELFGQIHKQGREWHAEIRVSSTGTIRRYAGIWKTRRDAEEEVEHILSPRTLAEVFNDAI